MFEHCLNNSVQLFLLHFRAGNRDPGALRDAAGALRPHRQSAQVDGGAGGWRGARQRPHRLDRDDPLRRPRHRLLGLPRERPAVESRPNGRLGRGEARLEQAPPLDRKVGADKNGMRSISVIVIIHLKEFKSTDTAHQFSEL